VFDFSGLMRDTKVDKAAFFALGSYDDKVRIVSLVSWQVVFVFHLTHPKDMEIAMTSHMQDSDLSTSITGASFSSSGGNSQSKSEEELNRVITGDHVEFMMVEKFESDDGSQKLKSSLDSDKATIHSHVALKALPKSSASTAITAG
jgi:hypothetical protein